MNGLIQKLAEMADISFNVEDMICAEITGGSNATSCPNWYKESHSSAKGLLIGVDTAWFYASPCITIAEFTCNIRGTYFSNYSLKTIKTYETGVTNGTGDIYKIVFDSTNISASCYLYENNKQDSSREYLAIFLKS